MGEALSFDYSWSGDAHYLAMHDITLKEGEISANGTRRSDLRDLRDRLTFTPKGMRIDGWSSLTDRRASYVALMFDPGFLNDEDRAPQLAAIDRPSFYFLDSSLRDTLRKLDRLLREQDSPDTLLTETLAMVAALELGRSLDTSRAEPGVSGLSGRQVDMLVDYIESHLGERITLDSLANVTGLSRYHFSRAFSATTGASPVQFVRRRRLERAEQLLRSTDHDLASIAQAVGFGGPGQFANAFKRHFGLSPTAYRKNAKG
jgi:AraC family transcriptional regulator